ncbi:MAG: FG-GAP repeat protein [Planctomycetes bacterium]|nr:FG-GAP repeat protein [Planctomycetota bacterium]MCB9868560.1 FG-GAP repeat protein [Planctomycetota bacterium]
MRFLARSVCFAAITTATGIPTAAQGDLAPTGLSCNHTVIHSGKQVEITSIVKNVSLLFATSAAKTAYVLSDDIFLTTSDVVLDTFTTKPLGPGQTDLVKRTVTIPNLISCKSYYIFVWANYDGQMSELNRLNNWTSIAVTGVIVTPSPTASVTPNLGRLPVRYRFDGEDRPNTLINGQRFGTSIADAGDFDRDGYRDLVVGAPEYGSSVVTPALGFGAAYVFSGKDGSRIWSVQGVALGQRLGAMVAGAGDVDNDGYADVVISGYDNIGIFSGRTRQLIRAFQGTDRGDTLLHAVAGVGDIDKDGFDEVLIGGKNVFNDSAIAYLMSGKDGSRLKRFEVLPIGRYASFEDVSVAGLGDINGDGYPDFAFAAQLSDRQSVQIFSGKSLTELPFDPRSAIPGFGHFCKLDDLDQDGSDDFALSQSRSVRWYSGKLRKWMHYIDTQEVTSLANAGDFDHDGYSDLIVAAQFERSGPRQVRVYSGADYRVLATWTHGSVRSVAGIGNTGRNGYYWVALGASDETPMCRQNAGSVWVYGIQPFLHGDVSTFSLAKANTLNMALDAGSAHQGRSYWVFGSVTGTSPGVTLGKVTVPLVPDPWTDLTIALANSPTFANTMGTLDPAGRAAARFVAGPIQDPTLVGLRLYYAYLVHGGGYHLASNPIQLVLQK